MNGRSCLQSTDREGSALRCTRSRRPSPLRATERSQSGSANRGSGSVRGGSGSPTSNPLSPVIQGVVAGLMDTLQSTGEGTLPLLLAIHPELSTENVAESDPEFVRRERLQSAAETRFFRTIEPARLPMYLPRPLVMGDTAVESGDESPSHRRPAKRWPTSRQHATTGGLHSRHGEAQRRHSSVCRSRRALRACSPMRRWRWVKQSIDATGDEPLNCRPLIWQHRLAALPIT
jgi:hypothetical protein